MLRSSMTLSSAPCDLRFDGLLCEYSELSPSDRDGWVFACGCSETAARTYIRPDGEIVDVAGIRRTFLRDHYETGYLSIYDGNPDIGGVTFLALREATRVGYASNPRNQHANRISQKKLRKHHKSNLNHPLQFFIHHRRSAER